MTTFSTKMFTGATLIAGVLTLGTVQAQSYGNPAQGGDPAQQQGGAPPANYQPAQPADVNDETLNKFADAYGKVQSIQQDFAKDLQQVSEESEAQELQRSAQDEMMEAVEDSGLSVTEYNEISVAVSADPELQARVRSAMEN